VSLVRVGVCGEHAVSVVRVKCANEEIGIVAPLLDGVAEQRFDVIAREDVGAALVERVDVNHER